ncbi:ADP-ribosylation factor, putative [Entamoeba invadens IP1]|uniref:ADP-ribosylation factor, putative n=1 Tax=Entamoeba invadens IP1 TaxID=370355 RepID=A0A0A1TWL1_ENTIV|nr:ADP-ribosylation factor, putative [Entamoeba invadens IP1]ELP85589.1 ADP-ribosylation factor, putative [Entamoeba invadens IP1]|eukprot:XP_004184935.1 ADP-ribosylation factor, putative [Entamoeba invadens IP1]
MGSLLSRLFGQKEANIIMVGLDGAGKTTILYQLKLKELVTTIPTIGINVESVKVGGVSFSVMDLGGQSKIRPLWRHYYEDAKAVVFVVDASDNERVEESRDILNKMCKNKLLEKCTVLVLGNKSDVINCLTKEQLEKELGVNALAEKHALHMVSAKNNTGITEAFTWLGQNL